jgi:GT2 family glycosyltransferase
MITISIIIVSYNTKEYLKKCLDSIFTTTTLPFEVIVVDNASLDGSAQFVKNEFRKVILVENLENYGFSKANNQGIKKSKGKYVLFLNPDTILEKDTISSMVKFMEERDDCGAATCKVVLESGVIDDASHRGFPTPWNSFSHFLGLAKLFPKTKLFGGYNMGWKSLQTIHEIDALAGAFMIVRRNAGEEVGWWDEDFFFYGEDIDFCYRLKEKKWKIYYVPMCKVLHYKGISHGMKKHSSNITTANEDTKRRSQKARFDAMKIFYKKHYMSKYPRLVTWLVMQGINIKQKVSS